MTRDEWKQMYSKPPSVWPSVAVTLALISSLVACKLVFPGGGTQNQTVIINVSGSGSDPSGNADTCKVAGGFQPTVATVPPADTGVTVLLGNGFEDGGYVYDAVGLIGVVPAGGGFVSLPAGDYVLRLVTIGGKCSTTPKPVSVS